MYERDFHANVHQHDALVRRRLILYRKSYVVAKIASYDGLPYERPRTLLIMAWHGEISPYFPCKRVRADCFNILARSRPVWSAAGPARVIVHGSVFRACAAALGAENLCPQSAGCMLAKCARFWCIVPTLCRYGRLGRISRRATESPSIARSSSSITRCGTDQR